MTMFTFLSQRPNPLKDLDAGICRTNSQIPSRGAVGSMSRKWAEWKKMGAPPKVVETLRFGLSIEVARRKRVFLPSTEAPELRAHVGELMDLGAYAETREATIVCPMFLIPKQGGVSEGFTI